MFKGVIHEEIFLTLLLHTEYTFCSWIILWIFVLYWIITLLSQSFLDFFLYLKLFCILSYNYVQLVNKWHIILHTMACDYDYLTPATLKDIQPEFCLICNYTPKVLWAFLLVTYGKMQIRPCRCWLYKSTLLFLFVLDKTVFKWTLRKVTLSSIYGCIVSTVTNIMQFLQSKYASKYA